VTGQFLAPGTYQDGHSFKLHNGDPCSAVYRSQSIGNRAGDPCYIMCGNLVKYEPAFIQTTQGKRKHTKLGLNND